MTKPNFLAIDTTNVEASSMSVGTSLCSLTPRIMQWQPNIWLLDLSTCSSYWLSIHPDLSMAQIAREWLSTHLQGEVTAAYGDHPWRCLLLLQSLLQRGLTGYMNTHDIMGKNLMERIQWEYYWSCVNAIKPHLLAGGYSQKNILLMNKQQHQLRQLIDHLKLDSPQQLLDMPPRQWQQRFGSYISMIWQWWNHDHHHDFPFHQWQPPTEIIRHRTLDYATMSWQNIEPLLMEDYNYLATKMPSLLLGSAEWVLTLEDLEEITLPIIMRHPHCLASDSPSQQVMISQSLQQFQIVQQQHQQTENDLGIVPAQIISWKIAVTTINTKHHHQPELLKIKSSQDPLQEDLQGRKRLYNQMPAKLERYHITQDWQPESSFATKAAFSDQKDRDPPSVPNNQEGIRALSENRPLYIYDSPQEASIKDIVSDRQRFLERTMSKWWLGSTHQRDYYINIDPKKQRYWTFQSNDGKWYHHGVYM